MQIRFTAAWTFLGWLPLASLLLGLPSPLVVAASGEVTSGDLLLSIRCHDLAQIDDCVTRISRQLEIPIPSPLSLLNTITGTDSGIAPAGNLCLQLLAGSTLSAEPRLCLQLPVTDFDRFVTNLGGNPENKLTTLQLAGQKLAAARRDGAVLLMDETDRPILQELISQDQSPEDETPWQAWSKDQNLVIRLTRLGLELAADRGRIQFATNNLDYEADTIVELDHQTDSIDRPATRWYPVWDMLKEFVKQYPGAGLLLPHAESLALGLRIHNEADLSVELRLRWRDDSRFASISAGDISRVDAVNRFQAGPFIFLGSGLLQPAVTTPLVRSYTLHQLASLADYGNDKYQQDDVEKLVDDIEAVLDDTRALSVIQRKTGRDEGVYGNTFLLLHTENADQVRDMIAKAFMSWNWLMDHAEGDICLQFNSTATSIADKPATEYTADMLKAVDATPLPEVKEAMKALFGPGGLYRIQLVPVDDRTVLLGNATVTQTAKLLTELGSDSPRLLESSEIKSLKKLFKCTPHFEFYIDPRELTSHQERTQKAELGEVLGGPLHRQFPDTPPLGVALRFDPGELHAALALTDKTLSGLVKYLKHEP
jgi:hypothetical protein